MVKTILKKKKIILVGILFVFMVTMIVSLLWIRHHTLFIVPPDPKELPPAMTYDEVIKILSSVKEKNP